MYYLLLFFLKLLSYVPFGLLYILSDILYYPLYYVVRYRRKIVRKNLTESFPHKSLSEILQIEKKFYRYFLDLALESCKLYSISPEEIAKRAVFINIDKVNAMLRDGKSVSVFIGHYSNWEWITSTGLWFDKKAVSVQIYRQFRNKSMNDLMVRLRERFGNKCVDMYDTVRFIANASKEGNPLVVGFLADQSPKRREAKHFLPFLNHNVPVLTGTEKLTKHFGFNAVFLSVKRLRRGYYEYAFTPLCDNPASLPDFELTALYFQRLEQEIQQRPEFFLWTHNRFKYASKPEQEV